MGLPKNEDRPKVNSDAQKELDRAQEQLDKFEDGIKELTLDRMNKAPLLATDVQTKISSKEIQKTDAPYIQPMRRINSKEPFNEKYRKEREEAWEYIKCICENNEIIGEKIEKWTKAFAGDAACFWQIPVNKPIYLPRFVAKEISNCKYHRLRMEDQVTNEGQGMSFYGSMAVDHIKNRLDCRPVGGSF